MNILLIAGHGDGDCGAVSHGYQEYQLTREFAKILKTELDKYDCNCDIAPTQRNYYTYLQKHGFDFSSYDYVLEIHFNAGGGSGTEIFVTTDMQGISVEENIVKYLSSGGNLKNRGVKKKNFYVINKIRKNGVDSALLEVCFIDNVTDMTMYINKKYDMAKAVALGIAKGFGLKSIENNGCIAMEERINKLTQRVTELENKLQNFNYIDGNMSDAYKPTIKKLVDNGYLKGDEHGLRLTEDMMRIFTILDRAGCFDK